MVFLVILLFFGAKRIPEIARGLGKGIREFKDATNDITKEFDMSDDSSSKRQNQIQAPRQQPVQQQQAQQQAQNTPPAEQSPATPSSSDASSS